MSKANVNPAPASTNDGAVPATRVNPVANLVIAQNLPDTNIFGGFEDRSLAPVVRPTDLPPGSIVIGRVKGFDMYSNPKTGEATVMNIDVLRYNAEMKTFEEVGQRAAFFLGTVQLRAFGTKPSTQSEPYPAENQIADMQKFGMENAIIAMRYAGTGKEKGKQRNAPHLWDIKIQRTDKSLSETRATAKKKSSK